MWRALVLRAGESGCTAEVKADLGDVGKPNGLTTTREFDIEVLPRGKNFKQVLAQCPRKSKQGNMSKIRRTSPRNLGYLPLEKLGKIPPRRFPEHELCFYLHDMMTQLIVEIESIDFRSAHFDLSESAHQAASGGSEQLIDHLLQSEHRPRAARMMLNHVLVALASDYLHFVYEALIALSKRKFAVAFSLLRKPFKENLLHMTWMLGDADDYFDKFERSPAVFMESRKTDSAFRAKLFDKALQRCILSESFDAALIERLIYDKDDSISLASLFDKATHLVTGARALRTEPMNLNFIFKDPRDDDIYDSCYSIIAMVLMYSFSILSSEIEKTAPIDTGYIRRRLLVSFMIYESLFTRGVPKIYRSLERGLKGLFSCSVCKGALKARRELVPRLLISERIICPHCDSDVDVPILWLMSQAEADIAH